MEALELKNRQLVDYIDGLERDLAGRMAEQVRALLLSVITCFTCGETVVSLRNSVSVSDGKPLIGLVTESVMYFFTYRGLYAPWTLLLLSNNQPACQSTLTLNQEYLLPFCVVFRDFHQRGAVCKSVYTKGDPHRPHSQKEENREWRFTKSPSLVLIWSILNDLCKK